MSAARLITLALVSALLTACTTTGSLPTKATRGPPPSATVFRTSDFAWATVAGRNAIQGRLTFQRPGVRYSCAGAGVILTPETLWTRRRMTLLYNSPTAAALPVDEVRARTPSAPSDDYSAFLKRTTCDAYDKFDFSGLPDGSWFVITLARPVGTSKSPPMAIMKRVETRRGKLVMLDL